MRAHAGRTRNWRGTESENWVVNWHHGLWHSNLTGAGVLPLAVPLQLSGKSSYDWIACITFRPGGHGLLGHATWLNRQLVLPKTMHFPDATFVLEIECSLYKHALLCKKQLLPYPGICHTSLRTEQTCPGVVQRCCLGARSAAHQCGAHRQSPLTCWDNHSYIESSSLSQQPQQSELEQPSFACYSFPFRSQIQEHALGIDEITSIPAASCSGARVHLNWLIPCIVAASFIEGGCCSSTKLFCSSSVQVQKE